METLQLNDPLRRSGSRRGRTFPDASNIPDPIDARVDDHVATTAGEPPVAAPTTRFTLPVDSLSRASSSRQGSPLQRRQQSFSPPTKSPDSWVGLGPREGQEVAGTREAEADVLSLSELHEQRKSLLSKLPNLRHNHHGDSSKSSSKKSETNGVSNNSYQTVPDLISITSEGPKTESMPNFRVHILDPTISGTTSTTNTTTSGSGRRLEAYRGHKRGNTNPLEQSSAIPVTRSGRTPAAPAERIEALSAVEERPHSSAGTSRNLCSTKSNVADSKCSRLPSFSVRTRNSSADYSPPDYHSVSGIVGVTSPLGLPTPNSTQNLSANGSQSLLNGTGSAQLSSFVEVPHRRTGRNLSDNTTEFGSLRVGSVGALSREDTTASEHRSIRHDSSRKSLKEARAVLRRRGAERSGAPIPPTHSRSTRTVSFTRRGHRGEERQSTNQLAIPTTGTSTRSGVNPRSCPLDGFHSDEYSGTHSHKGDFVEGIEQVVSEAGDSRGESSFFSRRASDNASLRSASRHDLPSSVTTQRMRSDQSPRQEDPQSPLRSVCVHSSAEFHGPLVELMGSPGDSQELPDEAPAAPPTRGRISSFRRSTTRRNRSSSRAVSITSRGDLAGSDDDSDSEDIRHKSVVDRLALQLAQNSRMYASLAAAPHEADGGRSTFDVPCLANGRDDGDAHPLPNSPTHGGEEAQSTAFGFSTSGWAALGEGETDANDWYAAMRKKQQDSDADEAPGEVEFPNEVAVDASASPAVEGATEAPDTAPVSTNPLEDGSHQLKLAQSSNSRGTNPTVVSVPSSLVKHNSSAVIGTTLDGGCVDSILSAGDKKGELSARHAQPEAHTQRQTTVQLVDPDAPFAVQLASTTMPLESILRENTSTVNRRVTEQTAPEEEEEAALHSPPSQKASPAAVPSPTASQLPPRPIALLLRPEPPKESQIASRAPRRIPGEMLLEPAAANRYASGPEGNSLTAPQTERSDTRHEARPRLNSSPTVTSSSRTPNSGQSPTGADLEVSFATAQQLPTVTPLPGHPRVTSADIMSRGNRASRGAKMSGGSSIQGSSASDKRGSAGSFANSGAGRRGSTHNITSGDSSF